MCTICLRWPSLSIAQPQTTVEVLGCEVRMGLIWHTNSRTLTLRRINMRCRKRRHLSNGWKESRESREYHRDRLQAPANRPQPVSNPAPVLSVPQWRPQRPALPPTPASPPSSDLTRTTTDRAATPQPPALTPPWYPVNPTDFWAIVKLFWIRQIRLSTRKPWTTPNLSEITLCPTARRPSQRTPQLLLPHNSQRLCWVQTAKWSQCLVLRTLMRIWN